MINITTESNQSFTSEFEMGEKLSPDFLFRLAINYSIQKRSWRKKFRVSFI